MSSEPVTHEGACPEPGGGPETPACVVCLGHFALHAYAHAHPDGASCGALEAVLTVPLAFVVELGPAKVYETLCEDHRSALAQLVFRLAALKASGPMDRLVGLAMPTKPGGSPS